MRKIGKISTIKRDYNSSTIQTMDHGLSKKGLTRIPGTGVFKFPYKEYDGKYRTGLDPDAAYIQRIKDPLERDLETKRVKELKQKLTKSFNGVDLGPHSSFWNHSKSTSSNDMTHVQGVKLIDGDNLYDLGVPWEELAYSWLRVHPTIASSHQAWERGEFPADTQFFVCDEEIENDRLYKKKQLINKAIIKFEQMTPSKRKKVARVMGLPISEDSKEEIVYNQVDSLLKQTEFKSGKYQGLSPIEVFTRFADMGEQLLHTKDLVKQAIQHSIYRMRPSGEIYQGEAKIARDEDALVEYLMQDANQLDVLSLEEQLKVKKIATV